MHPFPVDLELALQHLREHRQTGVMVAGDIHQTCPGTPTSQQCPHDVGVIGGPEKALGEAQRIDDVSHQHDPFGLDALQELAQLAHPRVLEAKVDVGEEQGSHSTGAAKVTGLSHVTQDSGACVSVR
jgi:hypothetical protein